jgi:hypothetical protein
MKADQMPLRIRNTVFYEIEKVPRGELKKGRVEEEVTAVVEKDEKNGDYAKKTFGGNHAKRNRLSIEDVFIG